MGAVPRTLNNGDERRIYGHDGHDGHDGGGGHDGHEHDGGGGHDGHEHEHDGGVAQLLQNARAHTRLRLETSTVGGASWLVL